MKFLDKIPRLNWVLFPAYAISMGAFWSAKYGLISGSIAGIFFALFMVLLGGVIKSEKINNSDLVVINLPRYYSYFCILAFWLFFLLSIMIYRSAEDLSDFAISIAMLGLSIFSLYAFYTTAKQFLIDNSKLIIKIKFSFFRKQTIYDLKDIKSMKVTWYQGLKITFANGKDELLYAFNGDLLHLRKYDGEIDNPVVEGLFRLKQEIQSRKRTASKVTGSFDISKFDNISFNPVGILGFFVSSFCIASMIFAIVVLLRGEGISRIVSEDIKNVRSSDVSSAFTIYKGPEFYNLKTEFEKTCLIKNDYNCRIAYYFNEVSNYSNSIEWIRRSCTISDPQSCYNLLIDKQATKHDKLDASIVLDGVCRDEGYKKQTCCRCYYQEKNKIRLPAKKE